MGKQVTVLVTQVEAARAGLPPPAIEEGGDMTDVVGQHLVTFRLVFKH